MKTLFYLLPFCLLWQNNSYHSFSDPSQSLPVNKSFFRIGDQLITLEKYGGSHDYVLVSLYNDQRVSEAAINLVQSAGTEFIRVINKGDRRIEADFFNKKLAFNPNRIFTSWGRRENLKMNKCWSKASDEYVQQFARFVLDEIPLDKTVVMFLDDTSSIIDFREGGKREKETKELFQNESISINSLFVTTDEDLFSRLKASGSNVVLQHPKKIDDDGALHVYCAKSNRKYLGVIKGNKGEEEWLGQVHTLLK